MTAVESRRIEISSYAPTGVVDAVRARRERKLASSEITLVGRRGRELQTIQGRVEFIAGRMQSLHARWITKKMDALSDYFSRINNLENGFENESKPIGDWRVALKEAYWYGLSTTVTQEYRLSKKEITPNPANFEDYGYIQDLITSYTFDFYRTLRVCERLNVAPGRALRLAKLAYKFNPNVLIELTQTYPEVDASIITRAAVHYPSNPDAFIDRVLGAIPRLSEKYPEVNASIIKSAAMGYPSNPDAFIDGVLGASLEEYLEFWVYLRENSLRDRVLSNKFLTPDELAMLEGRFEGRSKAKMPQAVLEKLSIAVANLAS